ncbi:MAG: response regulator transcription factor [Ilumatobacteraceae bacterium]
MSGTGIVVAEDSLLIREGLRTLFDHDPDVNLLATVGSLPELLAAVEAFDPAVVLTDIRMPPTGYDEGVRAAEELARTRPGIGVVVLSQFLESEFALRVFDGGAGGRAYLLKERLGDLDQLHRAIAAVANGETVLDPTVVDALIEGRRRKASSVLDRLSPRELQVLELMAGGSSNSAIAVELVLSERAVEKHISSILQKLDLAADDGDVHRRVRAVLVYLSETSG